MSGLEELGLSGLINSSQNIDNEIEVLRSKTLVKEVISQLNLYVAIGMKMNFLLRICIKRLLFRSV